MIKFSSYSNSDKRKLFQRYSSHTGSEIIYLPISMFSLLCYLTYTAHTKFYRKAIGTFGEEIKRWTGRISHYVFILCISHK
jgi:hypothetical protein